MIVAFHVIFTFIWSRSGPTSFVPDPALAGKELKNTSKMSPAEVVCYVLTLFTNVSIETNSVDPDHTVYI